LVGARGHHLFVKHIGRRFEAASVAVAHREASDAASPNAGSSNELLRGSAATVAWLVTLNATQAALKLMRKFLKKQSVNIYSRPELPCARSPSQCGDAYQDAVWGEMQSKTAATCTPRHIQFRMLPLE
jgi:hypothetical protein